MIQIRHKSDCALHNAPAYEPKPCDCGGEQAMLNTVEMLIKRGKDLLEAIETKKNITITAVNFKVWLDLVQTKIIK